MRMQTGSKREASDEAAFDCRVGPMLIQMGTRF